MPKALISDVQRVLFLAMILIAFQGCRPEMKEFCRSDLPEFHRQTLQIRSVLLEKGYDRVLASHSKSFLPSLLEQEREYWKNWTEASIANVQKMMSYAEDLGFTSDQLQELHSVANELVLFWGYADQGRGPGMLRTIEKLKNHSETFEKIACKTQSLLKR